MTKVEFCLKVIVLLVIVRILLSTVLEASDA